LTFDAEKSLRRLDGYDQVLPVTLPDIKQEAHAAQLPM